MMEVTLLLEDLVFFLLVFLVFQFFVSFFLFSSFLWFGALLHEDPVF